MCMYMVYEIQSGSHTVWPGWTQDQKIWGSIPTAGYVQRCWVNFLFRTASAYPAVMSTWQTRTLIEWLKLPYIPV